MFALAAWGSQFLSQDSYTGGRLSRYERALKPVHFWFYISFYCFLGVVLFVL